jgi:hypothetical protein
VGIRLGLSRDHDVVGMRRYPTAFGGFDLTGLALASAHAPLMRLRTVVKDLLHILSVISLTADLTLPIARWLGPSWFPFPQAERRKWWKLRHAPSCSAKVCVVTDVTVFNCIDCYELCTHQM